VTVDIETVNQNNETKTFTLCTLSETVMQQMYVAAAFNLGCTSAVVGAWCVW
jgi:hypothetical protein